MLRLVFCLGFFSIFSFASCNSLKLAIDIGHTPKRGGAVSALGVVEYEFNKRLAKELFDFLHKSGFKNSFIINLKGEEISLFKRVQIARDKNATLFLSLHHDSVQKRYLSFYEKNGKKFHFSNHFSGYSVFFSKYNAHEEKSKNFAMLLGDELSKSGLKPTLHHAQKIKGENRELIDKKLGVYQFEDLVVLKRASMLSVLLESGIIVNQDEEIRLNKKEYRLKIIKSIMKALSRYCKKE